MKVVVAPNAFKGSMDGYQAAESMKKGILKVNSTIRVACVPVADGGDGLLEVLSKALDGDIIEVEVDGPIGQPVKATFCHIPHMKTAVVEMAKASGLVLLSEEQMNPNTTSTFGTGQRLRHCLDLDVERIVLGLGGSATCDGGTGAAAALGYRFLDIEGEPLTPCGENLSKIVSIDKEEVDRRLFSVSIDCVCDVVNPLFGPDGASYVYNPQKGANEEEVQLLDQGLQHLAGLMKRDLEAEVADLPGGGAAGGLGAGVYGFFQGRLEKGIDLVMDLVDLKHHIDGADLVFTGEGRIDNQTIFDKAPAGVAKMCKEMGVPCVAVCGSVGDGIEALHEAGLTSVFSICNGPMNLKEAMTGGAKLLEDATEQVVRFYLGNKKFNSA